LAGRRPDRALPLLRPRRPRRQRRRRRRGGPVRHEDEEEEGHRLPPPVLSEDVRRDAEGDLQLGREPRGGQVVHHLERQPRQPGLGLLRTGGAAHPGVGAAVAYWTHKRLLSQGALGNMQRVRYDKVLLKGTVEDLNEYIREAGKCLIVDWRG